MLCNEVDSAAACFSKIDLDVEKEGAYKGLLMVYQKKHIADSVNKYAMLYAAANDSCYINVGQEHIAHIASMYRYGRFKAEAEKTASKLASTERIVVVALASLVCLAVIFYGYMVMNKRKRRRNFEKMKKLTYELNQTIKLLDAEKQTRAIDVEKYETLAHVMDEQGCKHNAEMVVLEEAIIEKDEKIEALQQRIDSLNKEVSALESKEDLHAFLESSIFKTFKYASSHPQYKVSDEEWETLCAMCRKTFVSYYDFVVSSNSISSDQMKVAILMRMGFAETEMAMILDVDNVRINRVKSQLNKKLFADNGAKTLRENLKRHF